MLPRLLYALFMLLALGVFLIVHSWMPKPRALIALPWRKRLALTLAGFIGGSLGAKLPFVLGDAAGWFSQSAWLADGKTITTALACAYLAVECTKLVLGIHVKTGDTFALPLALALAVGRWGCFFNGCCYGVPTTLPWAVSFEQPDGSWVRCHPTQVYESLFHLTMAGLLVWIAWRDGCRYQRLKLYLIAYGVYRFATEFIRPEPAMELGLTFYQWVALGLVLGLSIQWQMDRHRRPVLS